MGFYTFTLHSSNKACQMKLKGGGVAKGEMTEKGADVDRLARHLDVRECRHRGDGG
jgi:hypothetical protein